MAAARTGSTLMPAALAESSPISIIRSGRETSAQTGRSSSSAQATGIACSQPRPLRLPVIQAPAEAASWMLARVSRYQSTETSTAPTPIPTRTSR
nr:hypothetical protein GCM10020093_109680 [Planobispora longispora]